MPLRRLLFFSLLALVATSSQATASSWHVFSSKSLGFSLRYPADWKAFKLPQPGGTQLQFSHQGRTTYTVNVTVLNLKVGASFGDLKKRYLAYERRMGNTSEASMRWSQASLAGRHGMSGVYIPATEGGASVANGLYVIPWKSRTYVVGVVAIQKPAPRTLEKFPKVYKQILATWHFL